jgi:hypothetical protein
MPNLKKLTANGKSYITFHSSTDKNVDGSEFDAFVDLFSMASFQKVGNSYSGKFQFHNYIFDCFWLRLVTCS